MEVGNVIKRYVEDSKIPIYAVTGTDGFDQALPGWHPKELMPGCESIIIFGRQFIDHPVVVDPKTHLANESWWTSNIEVFEQTAEWRGGIINILDCFGFGAGNFGGFWLTTEPTFSYRMIMQKIGLGAYGRFGVCINPKYGCSFRIGVVLTDAVLQHTQKDDLGEFAPCENCSLCADICPVRAIDATKPPGEGYNRELCMRFILKIKEKHKQESSDDPYGVKVCNRCFKVCPWAKAAP
jgi:epoxyqueuosine reductase QueG